MRTIPKFLSADFTVMVLLFLLLIFSCVFAAISGRCVRRLFLVACMYCSSLEIPE